MVVVRNPVLGNVSTQDAEDFLQRVGRKTAPGPQVVLVLRDLLEDILGHVELVASKDQEPTRRGIVHQGCDEDVRVHNEPRRAFTPKASLVPCAFSRRSSWLTVPSGA